MTIKYLKRIINGNNIPKGDKIRTVVLVTHLPSGEEYRVEIAKRAMLDSLIGVPITRRVKTRKVRSTLMVYINEEEQDLLTPNVVTDTILTTGGVLYGIN